MYQTDQATAVSSIPTPASAGTGGFFTNGNPAGGQPATILDADFMNMLMMELVNVVQAGGITLSKTTYTQVLAAIKRICQNTTILADTGAANAYTATNVTPLVAGTWVDGVVQQVKIAHANTGASTFSPDGLTVIPIYGLGLQPLQGGELAVGGTAVLMHATIAGVNSGNPICVLMECAGGAQQVAPAAKSNHAVNLGQFETIAAYLASQSGTLGNPVSSTTYTPSSQSITFPSFSKSGAFRVLAQLVTSGFSQTNTVECQFQNQLFDGTNTAGQGNFWNVYKKNTGTGFAAADTFLSTTTYLPGATVTFLQRTVVQIEDTQFSLQNCFMRLWVVEA